jgi:hypothetical protein
MLLPENKTTVVQKLPAYSLEVATAAAVSRVLWRRQLETGEGLL